MKKITATLFKVSLSIDYGEGSLGSLWSNFQYRCWIEFRNENGDVCVCVCGGGGVTANHLPVCK